MVTVAILMSVLAVAVESALQALVGLIVARVFA